jgi:predicted DNA-binding protein
MALKAKNAALQIRLSEELLERFRVMCDAQECTVSEYVRRWMVWQVEAYERALEKRERGRQGR